jgi:hypothetical protein
MMSTTQIIERQAILYAFDLQNFAREHGCQTDENWKLTQATFDEKRELERNYQLTMSNKYFPEDMAELLKFVNLRLSTVGLFNETGQAASGKSGQYLVAFHSGLLKR